MAAKARHDALLALGHTIQRLEDGWYVPHGDDDHFDLHALPSLEFLRGMEELGEPTTFLDLGCGVGTKLLLAHWLGWEVTGVERHPDYADAARRLVPEADIHVGDAWTWQGLDHFDVVYSYRLVVDLERQHELNRSIIKRMRPGATYFCAGSDPDGGVQQLGECTWRVL